MADSRTKVISTAMEICLSLFETTSAKEDSIEFCIVEESS